MDQSPVDEDGDANAGVAENVLQATLAKYSSKFADSAEIGGQTEAAATTKVRENLSEACEGQSCLVCLENIASRDAVWSCDGCFTIYHLVCIQRWVKDGTHQMVTQQSTMPSLEDTAQTNGSTAVLQTAKSESSSNDWSCPKCRKSFTFKQSPTKYTCFCKKVVDPKPDLWRVPHSCGSVCGVTLSCKHSCLLLCHPGPHPPCPVTVKVSCFCGREKPQVKRCGARGFSCQKPCSRQLGCKYHLCPLPCHAGECPPCAEKSEARCLCGKERKLLPCTDLIWRCDAVCGKRLPCGRHLCAEVCHAAGACKPCVTPGLSTCPCGKTKLSSGDQISCIDEVQCCGDTCNKLLSCRIHSCFARCHKGECPPCNQMVTKRCRCMLKEKSVVCGGPQLLCDLKCKRKKECGRHACGKRCCDGNCNTCEETCGRTLNCGQHKCSSRCHPGLCWPCPLTSFVTCRCGKTRIRVPCGREKKTRPPRCNKLCEIPPDCHHKERQPHSCHFGLCPPCAFVCNKKHDKCDHVCHAPCHSAVLMDVNANQKPAGPWEKVAPRFELVALPCPPCMDLVPVKCIGEHEIAPFPCSQVRPYSCGKPCGRSLSCGNHFCAKICHVTSQTATIGQPVVECDECTGGCGLPRPSGCSHRCMLQCHPAPCADCKQMNRQSCHCGLSQKYIPCADWSKATAAEREAMLSCGNKCPKLLPTCGHRCTKICHVGSCSTAEECKKKVTIYCPCKRRKDVIACNRASSADKSELLSCDDVCRDAAAKLLADESAKREAAKKAEEIRRQKEKEEFDLKAEKAANKRRKRASREDSSDEEGRKGRWRFAALAAGGALIAIAAAVYLTVYSS